MPISIPINDCILDIFGLRANFVGEKEEELGNIDHS